jgi:hypothetical protein
VNDRRPVPGPTLRHQAEHVAGLLAENGQSELRWQAPDGTERRLTPRQTDLPALLLSEPGALLCPALDLIIERPGNHLTWSSADAQCARLFAQAPRDSAASPSSGRRSD